MCCAGAAAAAGLLLLRWLGAALSCPSAVWGKVVVGRGEACVCELVRSFVGVCGLAGPEGEGEGFGFQPGRRRRHV